jgi:branched-subunit amino acid aminotransferase/4-amino-4-deoxychorismate lyase
MGSAPVSVAPRQRQLLRESIRVVDGSLPLLSRHVERLSEGGAPDKLLRRVESRALKVASENPGAVKLQVVVDTADQRFSTQVSWQPSSLAVLGGPVLVPVNVAKPPSLPPNAAKPADRSFWDGPQRMARLRGGHQAALVLPDGTVVDGGTANVWAVVGQELVTPPAPPAVAGVARRVILEIAANEGLVPCVRPLTWPELERADEVLLSNAIGGLVAVRGRGGQATERLAAAFGRVAFASA